MKIEISVTRAEHVIVAHSVVTRPGGSDAPHQFEDGTCVAAVDAAVLSACGVSTPEDDCTGTEVAMTQGTTPGQGPSTTTPHTKELPVPTDPPSAPPPTGDQGAAKIAALGGIASVEGTIGSAAKASWRRKAGVEPRISVVSVEPVISAGLAVLIGSGSLELSSQMSLATDTHKRDDVIFQSGVLYLRPCLRWRPFAVCGTLGGGVGRDHAVKPLSESSELRLTTGARVAADVPIYRWMGLRLHGDVDVDWTPSARGLRPTGAIGSGVSLRLTFNDTLQRLEIGHGK